MAAAEAAVVIALPRMSTADVSQVMEAYSHSHSRVRGPLLAAALFRKWSA